MIKTLLLIISSIWREGKKKFKCSYHESMFYDKFDPDDVANWNFCPYCGENFWKIEKGD